MSDLSTQDRTSWADRIYDALVETAKAFRAWHDARDAKAEWMHCVRLRKRAEDAGARSDGLRAACRQAFADSRGWRWNRKAWTADLAEDARGSNGARVLDHVEFFDTTIGERKVALVTHSYAPAQDIADYAARRGYIAEQLPFSWHNPRFGGGCCCVVFTLKAGVSWDSANVKRPIRPRLNASVKALARRDRAAAVTLLERLGVKTAACLRDEQLPFALSEFEAALANFDKAAT